MLVVAQKVALYKSIIIIIFTQNLTPNKAALWKICTFISGGTDFVELFSVYIDAPV